MRDLLQIGAFPPNIQAAVEREFRCHTIEDLEREPVLADAVEGIVTRSNQLVLAEVVERLPRLGIIATSGVGYDLIPLDVAARRGIVVTNTPDVLNAAVAELCVGALLALLRKLPQADRFVREGGWSKGPYPLAVSLAGKRVGIVGLGRIGKDIAHRLEPFGVTIAYHGRTDQGLAWRYEPSLVALAEQSDILILVAPGSASTERMINAQVLEALGPNGYLVNVARGSLVDEDALIDALQRGVIAGAALDVFDDEPEIDPRFRELANVLLLPHIGSSTVETRWAMAQLMLDNLRAFFRDGKVLTPVMR